VPNQDHQKAESSPENCDAVIVGAGIVGLACAWRAAARGLSVCLVERNWPGAGASGVAAGMLAPVGEVAYGEAKLLELNLEAARAYPGFIAEVEAASGVPTGYQVTGALHVALDRDEAEELRRRLDFQTKLGLRAEWVAPSGCRELEPGISPSCTGAVRAPDEAAVDPRRLISALEAAFRTAGGELLTGAEVDGALLEGERLTGVRLTDGRELRADHVVLAAGAWSAASWLPQAARPRIRPVKGQILRLRATQGELPVSGIVASERVYMVPRADGELVVGATVEEMGFDRTVTAGGVHELLREAYRAVPDIAELELVEASAGLRPGTPDNLPLVGPGPIEGLILATGHYRNGVLLAPLAAERVVAALSREGVPVR
jgi:glycine oxidase